MGAAKGMGTGTRTAQAPGMQGRARVTGSGTHGMDKGTEALGAGKGPKGKGQGMGAMRGGRRQWRGTGGGAPPQRDVQPVRCIPPGIRQMPAHHTHHHHHHHAHLYNIDPDAGDLIPPQPP